MPIRNPFRRAGGAEIVDDGQRGPAEAGFKTTAVTGSKPLQIKEPTEYKLSGKRPCPALCARNCFWFRFACTSAYAWNRDQRQRSLPARKTCPLVLPLDATHNMRPRGMVARRRLYHADTVS